MSEPVGEADGIESLFQRKPELEVCAAFVAGFVLAKVLRQLGR